MGYHTGIPRIVAIFAVLAAQAWSRAADTPVIINTGTATATSLPGMVEFVFTKSFEAESMKKAIEAANLYLAEAQQKLRTGEMQPAEVAAIPPAVAQYAPAGVTASVRARFGMSALNAPSTGPVQFGALCDMMAATAAALGAGLSPPALLPADRDFLADRAVTMATENAYSQAEAVASAVKSAIYSVREAEILDITWTTSPAEEPGEVPQVGCTARVRVTYLLAPAQ